MEATAAALAGPELPNANKLIQKRTKAKGERMDDFKILLVAMAYEGLGYSAFVLFASVGYNLLAGGSYSSRVPTVALITGLAFVLGCAVGLVKCLARK